MRTWQSESDVPPIQDICTTDRDVILVHKPGLLFGSVPQHYNPTQRCSLGRSIRNDVKPSVKRCKSLQIVNRSFIARSNYVNMRFQNMTKTLAVTGD